jgi:hypothetical protein
LNQARTFSHFTNAKGVAGITGILSDRLDYWHLSDAN